MSFVVKLVWVVLGCMGASLLLWLGQALAEEPASWLKDLLGAVVVVGLAACLLLVAAFVLG